MYEICANIDPFFNHPNVQGQYIYIYIYASPIGHVGVMPCQPCLTQAPTQLCAALTGLDRGILPLLGDSNNLWSEKKSKRTATRGRGRVAFFTVT